MEMILINGQPIDRDQFGPDPDEMDPYCFICRRCTDHVGEHDELVEAGAAVYGRDFTVSWADGVDVAAARDFIRVRWFIIETVHPFWYLYPRGGLK